MRPADDGRLRRHRAHVVARARIAIAGEIGLQKIALCLRLALERAELDLGPARAARLELLHGGFRLGHLGAQHLDLGVEPGGRVLGLLERRLALPSDIDVGELVGDLRREAGIAGGVVDGDHARLGQREH